MSRDKSGSGRDDGPGTDLGTDGKATVNTGNGVRVEPDGSLGTDVSNVTLRTDGTFDVNTDGGTVESDGTFKFKIS